MSARRPPRTAALSSWASWGWQCATGREDLAAVTVQLSSTLVRARAGPGMERDQLMRHQGLEPRTRLVGA
jgi:putative NIF3 family GTP cyclohydrolase 1 type 2